jgi:hypothetical protein
MAESGGQKPKNAGLGAVLQRNVIVEPPETAEEFIALALQKSDLDRVVVILRDICGRKEITKALDKLVHRDPVSQITQIVRHAVEAYAIRHNITPSNLMVKLGGMSQRSEREKLTNAKNYLEASKDALTAARALAEKWEADRPSERDVVAHLKNYVKPKV